MIIYVKKDLFESPAQVLVNTVNTVGVMGKGIAKRFKDIYPEMFNQYQQLCESKMLEPGKLWIYKSDHKWILNFPTKKHWRSPSKIEYIEEGLKKFVETYEEKGINSISFPLLGCGNGGLDWETQVKPLMEKYLRNLPIEIFIHLSDKRNKPEHKDIRETKKWLQSMPAFLSFNEVWDDVMNVIQFDGELLYNSKIWEVQIINQEIDEAINNAHPESAENIQENPTIVFTSEKEYFYATKEQIHGLWRYLKKVGFCVQQDLPEGLSDLSGLIFSLLNKLDYIEPVELAYNYSNENDFHFGIRVIPYKVNDGNVKGEKLNEVKER